MSKIIKFVFLVVAVAVLSGCGGGTQVIREEPAVTQLPANVVKEKVYDADGNIVGEKIIRYEPVQQVSRAHRDCAARYPDDQRMFESCLEERLQTNEMRAREWGKDGRRGQSSSGRQQPAQQQRQVPWGCLNPLMAYWPHCASGQSGPPAVPSSYVDPRQALLMNPIQAYQPGYGGNGLTITFGQ